MTTQLVREGMKALVKAKVDPVDFHWFDATGCLVDQTEQDQEPLHTNKPPFPQCMVCWKAQTKNYENFSLMMGTKGDDLEKGIMVTVWRMPGIGERVSMSSLIYVLNDGKIQYGPIKESENLEQEDAHMILGFLSAWYDSLSKRCEVYIPTVEQTFTNRRKIAQGKFPSYEWRTVTIEPAKPKLAHKGGTHASPRLHDRRGHTRKLASGKMVWIRNCKVGHPNKGVIFHDYKISGE
jgi:hypothetical protein